MDGIIEGSVLRAADRVRITTQLIALNPERHLWAESYDGDLSDVLGLHSRVAQAIAAAVQSTLRPGEAERSRSRRQVEPAAYEAYLEGRFAAGQVSDERSLREAMGAFELAIRIDATFAQPWVGIARALGYLALFGHADREATLARAREAISHALTLDSDLAEALATRGHLSLVYNADGAAAVRDLERAVALEPNSVPALLDCAVALNSLGRHDEAADAFDRAAERDPLSPTTAMMRGWGRFVGRRYEEACRILEQNTRLSPGFSYNHLWLAASLLNLERHDEARARARRAQELQEDPDDVNFLGVLGWLWGMLGERERALEIREALHRPRPDGTRTDPGFLVVVDAALGDLESALDHQRRAVADRAPSLFHMRGHPMLDTLRGDARAFRLLERAGLLS